MGSGLRTAEKSVSLSVRQALPSGITSLFLSLLFHVAAVSRSLSHSLALAFLLATSFPVFFWTFVLYFVRGGLSVVVVIVTGVLPEEEEVAVSVACVESALLLLLLLIILDNSNR